MRLSIRNMLSVSCLFLLSAPSFAVDLNHIIAVQEARIKQLERAIPQRWHARQYYASNIVATKDWQDIPGLKLEVKLTDTADVKLEFDGSVSVETNNVHCAIGFKVNDQLIGHSVYGDAIVMGQLGTHWQSAARSVMLSSMAPGIYKITLAISSAGVDGKTCSIASSQDYSRFNLYATAYKK